MESKNSTLYIIGNGFDRNHHLKTEYEHFYSYLKANNDWLLQKLSSHYNVSDPKEETKEALDKTGWLWSDFEKSLEYFDDESLIQWIREIPFAGSDNLEDQDYDSVRCLVFQELKIMKEKLQDAFNNWIESIDIKCKTKFIFAEDSLFFSFNYTKVLEEIYKIPDQEIIHIHGKVGCGSDLMFGHGWDLKKQNEEEKKNDIVDLECKKKQYSIPRYNAVNDDVNKYLSLLEKPTEKISWNYSDFFDSLGQIKNICILGCSLSSIDSLYFQKITQNINIKSVKWYISFYDKEGLAKIPAFRDTLQIPKANIKKFKMEAIHKNYQIFKNKILRIKE